MGKFIFNLLIIGCLTISYGQAASKNQLETCTNEKEFKNLLKTKPNLLILFGKNDAESKGFIKLLKEVNPKVAGLASIAYVNCEVNKKVCKKQKVSPEPTELKHYHNGKFNTDYERSLQVKSIRNFLADPTGDLPWEEEPESQDVIHISEEKAFNKLIKKSKVGMLVMFYAPWCGHCKKLKPDYSKAATELKGQMVAVDCDLPGNMKLKSTYNITGFPTLSYFKGGKLQFPYGGEHNLNSLIEWMSDPSEPKAKEPEKSWAEEADVHVTFLTTETFDNFIETHKSVLVKFYAPWCGHCKTMKPIFNNVAKQLKEENHEGVIAFVDTTVEQELGTRFKIKGFPTIKYFQNGEFAYDYSERDEKKILEFMRDPKQPEAPKKEPEWKDDVSDVIHATDDNFAATIKTKKHALGFFYAPWCGHCKTAKPFYTQAAAHFKDDLKTAFIAVDCTIEKAVCEKYSVKGFPTIIYFNFGKNPTPYEGGRELKDFIKFMSNPKEPNAGKFDPRDDWLEVPGNEHLSFLDDKSFDEYVNSKPKVLVMFYAPWCGHCKTMKPAYGEAATEMKKFLPGAYLAAVDATKTSAINKRFELKGFPTIKYFENGKFKFDYSGGRTKDDIVNFMKDPKEAAPPAPVEDDWSSIASHEHVNMLTDKSFDEFVNSKPKVLVMFYAPWCGHCKTMKPAYSEAATDMKKFLPGTYLAAVDATQQKALAQRFELKGFPTLKYFENGKFKSDYNGGRTKDAIVSFMRDGPSKQEL